MNTETQLPAVEIFTDGACSGNPGPGGWGAILRAGAREKELWGGAPETTNNRMELSAVIYALRALKRAARVDLYTDSQYVQKGITQWLDGWKRRGWKTAAGDAVKNRDLWQALEAAAAAHAHELRWRWVKGHAGHAQNERADALARAAAARVRATGAAIECESRDCACGGQ